LDNKKDKSKKNELSQPHDATFKKLFGEREIAKDVIEKNLPKEVLDELDMESLERLDGSFINEKLKETFSDIIYGVKLNNRDAYIALLMEHKSYTDKLAIFQVAGYILDVWRKTIEDGKKELPVVIPLLVYHGKARWNYKKDIREMIPGFNTLPEYLQQMLPVLRHDFINITEHNEEDIKEYKPVTRMVLRSFKYIFEDKDKLIEAFVISIDEIESEVTEEELNKYVDIFLIYYSAVNKNLTEEDIIQKIQELGKKESIIMTILQEREEKGMQKGIELGREQGMEQGMEQGIKQGMIEMAKNFIRDGVEIEIVIRASKLSRKEIEEIKKEILN
jgi:predicted transposase/invertase (TIGR01784 family)